jgi:AraC-like DNA-binding protein
MAEFAQNAGEGAEPHRLQAAVPHHGVLPVRRHHHQHHELVLVLEGSLVSTYAGAKRGAGPGMVYVLPAGTEHDQECRGRWKTFCVLFSGPAPAPARVASVGQDALLAMWIRQLQGLVGDPAGDALLSAVLLRLESLERQSRAEAALPPVVLRAVRFLERRLLQELDVGELGRHCGVSPSHLRALFTAHLGRSPKRYHLQRRMEQARRVLGDPYASIAAAARATGFSDAKYFARCFRAVHGVAPRLWRQIHG